MLQSGVPSDFRGTVTPAASSQRVLRRVVMSRDEAMESTPYAFFIGANSSIRSVS